MPGRRGGSCGGRRLRRRCEDLLGCHREVHEERQAEHREDRKERRHGHDSESRETASPFSGRIGDADPEREHQRNRHRSGCHGTTVPRQPEHLAKITGHGKTDREQDGRDERRIDHRLERPAVKESERAQNRGEPDTDADQHHQRKCPGSQQRIEVRSLVDVDERTGRLQRPDRGFGKGHPDSEQKGDCQHHGQRRARRQGASYGLAEGHETNRKPLHEEHQAKNDREQPGGNGQRPRNGLLQNQNLERDEVDRERNDCA